MNRLRYKIQILILLPLIILTLLLSIEAISSAAEDKETDITNALDNTAAREGYRLQLELSKQESQIKTIALSTEILFDSTRYRSEGDSYLVSLRDRIAPLLLNTARQLPMAKGIYLMFSPDTGSKPSQIWYNRSTVTGSFERIFEYPSPKDYIRGDPAMDYYYIPLDTGKPYWSHPYRDKETNQLMISYSVPVISRDNTIGIVGLDISIDTIISQLRKIRFLDSGYSFLLDDTARIIYHPLFPVGSTLAEAGKGELDFLADDIAKDLKSDILSYRFLGKNKKMGYYRLENNWILGITAYDREIFAPVRTISRSLLFSSLLFFLITALLSLFTARIFTRPVERLTGEIREAAGNFESILSDGKLLARKDELGILAREVAILQKAFRETLQRVIATNIDLERMAQLGRRAGIINHEVKTPLGVVLTSVSYASDLLNEMKKKISANSLSKKELNDFLSGLEKSFSMSLRSLDRARLIMDDFRLSTVSRSVISTESINLYDLLEEVFSGLLCCKKDKTIMLINKTKECPPFESKPGYLIQVFTNLINNSLLHGFHKKEKGTIEISSSISDSLLIIDYSDDGVGIPGEFRGKIFEPFFTSARDRGGTGLGMHIIRMILTEYLDSSIEYIPEHKPGVLFRITLPFLKK